MFRGKILAIGIAPQKKAPLHAVESVDVHPTHGLTGDRYWSGPGSSRKKPLEVDQEVTLIESEAIQEAAREYNLPVTHAETRRNLLTEGVPLNHLVGRSFVVGEVILRGIQLCEPCKYLEKLTQKGMIKAFQHRGGLRAQVISGGKIHVGDPVHYINDDPKAQVDTSDV